MFQNVNVAKSAPFALLTIYQKILVSPQSFLNCPHFGKLREIRRPFFDLNNEKWNPQISQRITRKSLNLPPKTMNHANSAQFLLNPTNPCSPTVPQPFFSANLTKFAQFANTQSERREINQFRTNSSTSYILYFQTLVRQDPIPCLRELREFRNLKFKFAKMPLLISLHNILTL